MASAASWLFLTVLDDFRKAGGIHAVERRISLILTHPELQPVSLRKPLLSTLLSAIYL